MYAVITGASRGIGRAIALRLAREGCHLYLCSRDLGALQQLEKEIHGINPGCQIRVAQVDVGHREELKEFSEKVTRDFGQVDLLVNNAGKFISGALHQEAVGVLEDLISVNLLSAYHLTRFLLPMMMARKSGYIFNICSTASLQAYPNGGAYSISKFALLGFSKNLREELKPFHIRVSAICPGPTLTDSWLGSGLSADRFLLPEDIAQVIWSAYQMSGEAVLEEIVLRPLSGDI
ncbi:MAG: SDR family oxidoreductase [Chitinophagaceae bacterium]